jgi:predicted O-linked N-acetylglucosamine transferase (SPINDLY family)
MLLDQLLNSAFQLYSQGQIAEAQQQCQQVLSQDPGQASAVYLLAAIDQDAGRFPAALEGFARSAAMAPENPVFMNAWGEALHTQKRNEAALQCYRTAITLRSTYERAHNNLGRLLHEQSDLVGAEQSFREAIRLNPNYAIAHNNLGSVLLRSEQPDVAISCFRQALSIRPGYPEAEYNWALALRSLDDPTGTLPHLDRAIQLRPNYAKAYLLLGQVFVDLEKVAQSVACFEKAVALQPDELQSHLELGNVLMLLNRLEEAQRAFEAALTLKPDHANAFAQLCRLKATLIDWTSYPEDLRQLREVVDVELRAGRQSPVPSVHAFSLPFPRELLLKIAASQSQAYLRYCPTNPGENAGNPTTNPNTDRLRIAYLSRDFYDHPVAHQFHSILSRHDRSRFEIHAYSYGPDDQSSYRQRIASGAEVFHDVSSLNDQGLADRIRADGIQILVDLMGYTGFSRTKSLAMRPAPIQACWLGYASTMGAEFVDYLIGDNVVTPPEHAQDYREALVRLPHSFMPTDPSQPILTPRFHREELGLPAEGIVFCCFNNSHKITPEVFQVWMRILKQVPGSVAWLNVNHPVARANLRQGAQDQQIDPERLVFATRVENKAAHLARLQSADLFLDTIYYNAHVTACDALWAGLPVLTTLGETFAGRVGASLLSATGLPELIARDLQDYEKIAIRLAQNQDELKSLRDRLRPETQTTLPLFEMTRFVGHLEQAYQTMWGRYQSGMGTSPIDVAHQSG